jgi:hypothetical protein
VIRVTWTVTASVAYMVLALTSEQTAIFLVPAFCFAVVLPYGIAECQRRWARYRQDDDGPGTGNGSHSRGDP